MPFSVSAHQGLRTRVQRPAITSVASVLVRRQHQHQHHHHYHYYHQPAAIRDCYSYDYSYGSSSSSRLLARGYATRSSLSKSHSRPPSAGQPDTPTVPSTTSTATTTLANDVNPPPSTRPADLNLPEPASPAASPADKLKRYIAVGRAYLAFYKTGLKNVYHNYRAAIPLRRALHLPAYLPTSPPATRSFEDSARALTPPLSRASFQLVRRAAYDLRRMIPFSLLLLVCGELTPLVVLALGNAVTPFTCRVPRQRQKERALRAARKRAALAADPQTLALAAGSDAERRRLVADFASREWIDRADDAAVLRACAALGLVRSHVRPAVLVGAVYRPRLRRYAEYLALDDRLLRAAAGGVSALEAVEVRIAVEERGGVGVADGLDGWEAEREERRWLEKWLERS
ncbi:uncharacterized protein ACLA_033770 [Aspergillus clavatus NRRL 1]|uniref:Letm1 RBD domain-containing protein n=1 Tax=Aspergillus clavatus (strain ATCC 1007 / CBS 513.65 / DSM 816 / NCTC 3887 / NRRL 1 / QM 1276 / 107) TaxID=344612 RepID=A1CJ50_ASPCL|nr:uncharacterized protein ACLA_033770 [Aspergillus clavatus NRRL 1]EAW09174.1 conserved hypothetical protein [Aspergillus clavatus NRRL 1]